MGAGVQAVDLIVALLALAAALLIVVTLWRELRDWRAMRQPAVPSLPGDSGLLLRLAQAVEQSANLVVIANADGLIEYVNPRFCEISGYSRAEIYGQPVSLLDSGVNSGERLFELWQNMADGKTWRGELCYRRKDGSPYWVSCTISPVRDTQTGLVTHSLSIQEDITAQRAVQAAEQQQRRLAEALARTAAALTHTLDPQAVLDALLAHMPDAITAPLHSVSILLLEPDDTIHVARHRRLHDNGNVLPAAVRFPLETVEALGYVYDAKTPQVIDAAPYPWLQNALCAPICAQDEVFGFLIVTAADTALFTSVHTGQLTAFADQAAAALVNARLYQDTQQHAADLRARNTELDAFSHVVAHDLRNPLHQVVGYLELVEDRLTDPEGLEYLLYARRASEQMAHIIETLLNFARFRDAEQPAARVAMQPVVEAALTRFQLRLASSTITLTVQPDLPDAWAHGPWVEEVFANLIDNAIKYIGEDNPTPRITISGAQHGETVRYAVADNGIGISKQAQTQLFEQFARFHEGKTPGFGLGLSIVWRIVRRLGGQVGVESTAGQGSTFWFTLPAPADDACAGTPPSA